VNRLIRHSFAFFSAVFASAGAALAMLVVMLAALFTAGPANLGARSAEVGGELGTARHELRGHGANQRAVSIEFDAACHHLHIVLAQAFTGAVFTFGGAFLAGFNTAFVFLVWHKQTPSVRNFAHEDDKTSGARID
jgi:hypothetical protein